MHVFPQGFPVVQILQQPPPLPPPLPPPAVAHPVNVAPAGSSRNNANMNAARTIIFLMVRDYIHAPAIHESPARAAARSLSMPACTKLPNARARPLRSEAMSRSNVSRSPGTSSLSPSSAASRSPRG